MYLLDRRNHMFEVLVNIGAFGWIAFVIQTALTANWKA